MNIQQFRYTDLKLMRALYLHDFKVASLITKYCSNKRILDYHLIKYSKLRNVPFVKLLLENGADIHVNDDYCLITSCNCAYEYKSSELEFVKLLVHNGANVNARAGTPLSLSSLHSNRFETVKFLLDHGANPNTCSSYLVNNCIGDERLMKLLIEYGLDISQEYESVIFALGIREHHQKKLFNFLIDHNFVMIQKLN